MHTAGGRDLSAAELQQIYLDLVLATYERLGETPDEESRAVLDLWGDVLDRMRADLFSVAPEVEWVAKYQLLSRLRERLGVGWDDARLAALDLQWSDLRPGHSLVARLDGAGRVRRLFTPEEVERAADEPPTNTRALARGRAVAQVPNLVKASWTSLVVDEPGRDRLLRRPVAEAGDVDEELLDLLRHGRILQD